MYKAIIFGGTSEGRELYESLSGLQSDVLYWTATDYGAVQVEGGNVRSGRLDTKRMTELFSVEKPKLVIDATHPYADIVSANIKDACESAGVEYLRVKREAEPLTDGFSGLDEMTDYLKGTTGVIFSTLGVKAAAGLTALPDYRERVWLRVLPSVESVTECLRLGYPPKRLICMQGPFSKELNSAMFRETGAEILLTKESGGRGGYDAKISAAREMSMTVLVLKRPEDFEGVLPGDALERILAL